MRVTAEAITQCKFEATDPSADEVVLYNILQVRGTLLLVTCAGNGTLPCAVSCTALSLNLCVALNFVGAHKLVGTSTEACLS